MGLFRKKRKPKYVEEILEFDGQPEYEIQPEFERQVRQEPDLPKKEKKSIAMEYCEQILTAAKDLEETKREYKMLTDYLTDIQMIENLPAEEFAKIQETAQSVMTLNESRDSYLNKSKTISDSQYVQMEQLESEMPGIIKRLKENEAYQSTVKRDMQYLEGEKEEWRYYKESLEREEVILRRGLYGLVGVFGAAVLLILVLGTVMKFDIKTPLFIAALIAGAAGGTMVWRLQNDGMELKKSQANINRAITLMNKIKFKYVNVTNAVDYACEKYHVKNSYELNYIWDQYMEAVKEREKYERTNDDLEYFNGKLIRQLHGYHLYDARIWIHQARALLDKKEMVEVKHELIVRRQKLRARMENQVANIQGAKEEIEKLVKEYPGHETEIAEILDSLDKICGIG